MHKDRARMERAMRLVLAERKRQDLQWGGPAHDDTHTPSDWISFIEYQIVKSKASDPSERQELQLTALVKIAAIAMAGLESADRLISVNRSEVRDINTES